MSFSGQPGGPPEPTRPRRSAARGRDHGQAHEVGHLPVAVTRPPQAMPWQVNGRAVASDAAPVSRKHRRGPHTRELPRLSRRRHHVARRRPQTRLGVRGRAGRVRRSLTGPPVRRFQKTGPEQDTASRCWRWLPSGSTRPTLAHGEAGRQGPSLSLVSDCDVPDASPLSISMTIDIRLLRRRPALGIWRRNGVWTARGSGILETHPEAEAPQQLCGLLPRKPRVQVMRPCGRPRG